MLHVLRQRGDVELVGLLTTFNEAVNRVAMHGVRRDLVEWQAAAVGLSLWPVMLPWPCSNADYEARMRAIIERAVNEGVTHVAFGDLYLEEIRDYRIRQLQGTGIEPMFPIWCGQEGTRSLAEEMLNAGLQGVLTCVDPKQLSPTFAGRQFDEVLLNELPSTVDPCGENGEFHTFCHAGPMFSQSGKIKVGETIERDGFVYADVKPGWKCRDRSPGNC